jgi:DNA-binding MarR family transcriptional regulator
MRIQEELLANKNLNPLQKLILGLITDTPPIVIQMTGGYDKTCSQIGKLLGVSRERILEEFEDLIERNLITSEKGSAWRRTKVTQQFLGLLEGLKKT